MARPCRVLAVEDDADQREVLEVLLRDWGHEVCLLPDATDLLAQAAAFDPDVILMDIHLAGEEDGIAAVVRMRDYGNVAPVLLMSAQYPGVVGDMTHYASIVGAQGYIAKPFEFDVLERAIQRCCAQKR